ncbi:MAG: fatty acid--CoA ligase family protein [Lentisphaeria bacterium]
MIDFLRQRFRERGDAPAIVWRDTACSYAALAARISQWRERLAEFAPGTVVGVEADFSPAAAALFFALAEGGMIIVPSAADLPGAQLRQRRAIAQVAVVLRPDTAGESWQTERCPAAADTAPHPLYETLRSSRHPGLVLFSSGSTGEPKAMLHDLDRTFARLREPKGRAYRGIAFLLFDHIGGINTLLHVLATGGCLITVASRDPDVVLAAVARHRAELLPTSPTFLNLVLLSEAWKRHDLASLKVISYGTEPMPESTLRRLHELLPAVRLQQTYGLSESGILRIQSKSSDSPWIKPVPDGYQIRIVAGQLQVKSDTAMLGYLNAPSPFTDDGWLRTGDAVETDGEYLRILGRQSELINVGGQKVYPVEVEGVLEEMPNVAAAVVYGERNPITGAIVCARVQLAQPEERSAFLRRLREHCAGRLEPYKIPVRVTFTAEPLHGDRFKKLRK